MGGACGTYGKEERCIQGLVVRPKGESPLERPRCSLEDNIKVDRHEVGWGGMDWMDTHQDRESWRAFLNAVMKLRLP
jgi:hypothetical protein